jgi:hypothetical protein
MLFPEAPSIEHVKLFLQWLVRCSVGLIEDKMTDVTLGNYLSALKRAVKDHTNYQYNRAQNQVLAAVCIASTRCSTVAHTHITSTSS